MAAPEEEIALEPRRLVGVDALAVLVHRTSAIAVPSDPTFASSWFEKCQTCPGPLLLRAIDRFLPRPATV